MLFDLVYKFSIGIPHHPVGISSHSRKRTERQIPNVGFRRHPTIRIPYEHCLSNHCDRESQTNSELSLSILGCFKVTTEAEYYETTASTNHLS